MYRLEYLANFARNKEACAIITNQEFGITNPFSLEDSKHTKTLQKRIGEIFGREYVQFFGCTKEDFIALFLKLGATKSALSVGFSQAAYQSFNFFENLQKLIMPTPQSLCTHNAQYYFIPYIDEDILRINPILEYAKALDSMGREYVLFVEISALLQVGAWESITSLSHPNIAFVVNAERIGLMPRSGCIIHSIPHLTQHIDSLLPNGFLESLLYVCQQLQNDTHLWQYCTQNYNALLLQNLQNLLGDRIGVFTPLQECFGNCLALRISGIKARVLAQSLLLEDVAIINGMDCLLGNFKPSFVLRELGYEDAHCRELISISFMNLSPSDLTLIAQKIAKVCEITQALEI